MTDAGQGAKYANAAGNCCGEWMIEFRTNYEPFHSDKCMELAIAAWNNAPRAANAELTSPPSVNLNEEKNYERGN